MPLIKTIASAKKKKGTYTITVPVGNPNNSEVNTVDVSINDEGQPTATPNPVILTFDSTSGEDRIFKGTFNFSENAVGLQYPMTATMKDAANEQIARKKTQEVTIQAAKVPTEA